MRFLLPLLLLVTALHAQDLSDDDTRQLLARIAQARQGASMQSDFREEKYLSIAQKPVIESGTLAFSPPNKFRREVKDKSLTVCNGETLWLYYPGFQQVEEYSLASSRALKATFDALSSALDLQESLLKTYNVKASKSGDGYQLILTPRSGALKRAASQITLTLDGSLAAKKMEIVSSQEERSLITFSNEKRVKLSPSDFEFKPPAGVVVTKPLGR